MYLGYTWDIHEIHERDIPHVGKFSILVDSVSEWVSEWVTDMPGSRDAYASKNLKFYSLNFTQLQKIEYLLNGNSDLYEIFNFSL